MTIAVLYAALGLAALLLLARADVWRRRRKWARRRARYGGDVTEAVAREIRFYDDQAEPRDLIW